SAGGLKAIETVLSKVPPYPNMAFVIVQHLSPNFKSLMQEILSKDVPMPVKVAEDEMEVLPNHIFLIPAGQNMTIEEGKLKLVEQKNERPHFVIDLFFHSLAKDSGKLAIAIILSGTGSDGSRGIQSIRKQGGVTIVQDPDSGEFDGMPLSAIETGTIDYILSPEEIADFISNGLALKVEANKEIVQEGGMDFLVNRGFEPGHLATVLDLLYQEQGLDFSQYKEKTLLRRIERNMGINEIEEAGEYIAFLKRNPAHVNALFNEILIGVTEFFRDPSAFEILNEQVFPALEEKMKSKDPIRIWVCGCSTGEEVYSLGMALNEYAERRQIIPNFTILATDVSPEAVATASRGHYSAKKLEMLSDQLATKYFNKNGNSYEIIQQMRDRVIFAVNDAISDPPFINLDLISCRNLLIYFKQTAQRRVLLNFHFGLNSGGYLLLGSSENILDYQESFRVINEKWKLFQAYGDSPKYRDVQNLKRLEQVQRAKQPIRPIQRLTQQIPSRASWIPFINVILRRYAPPFAIFNENFTLLYSGGGASQFLQVPEMSPTTDLLDMVSDPTVVALRDSIRRFGSESGPFLYQGTKEGSSADSEIYDLLIARLESLNAESHYIIEWKKTDQENGTLESPIQVVSTPKEEANSYEVVRVLQEELRISQHQTQSIREELESTNEE
ncbi:MAG: chemotaxis protein CheB, partial [Bacteroidota bacterium]